MAGNHHNASSLLQGILIGSAVGALTGFLLAPKSGKELRSDIKEKGFGALDGTKRFGRNIKSKAKAVIEGTRSGVHQLRNGISF